MARPLTEIPPALIRQLEHSLATGARCIIELTESDDQADVAELRRALRRAQARHFPNQLVRKEFRADHITYWVERKEE